jgi:signal transduction histidine kinase
MKYDSISGSRMDKGIEKRLDEYYFSLFGEFFPGYLHNIGTPINVILGNSQLVSLDYDKQLVEDILKMAIKLKENLDTYNEILQLTIRDCPTLIDPGKLVDRLLHLFQCNLDFKRTFRIYFKKNSDFPKLNIKSRYLFGILSILLQTIIEKYKLLIGTKSVSVPQLNIGLYRNSNFEITIECSNKISIFPINITEIYESLIEIIPAEVKIFHPLNSQTLVKINLPGY